MFLHGRDSQWEVRAPAKINLLLEVRGRRDDGFHEVETLMVPVTLFDVIHFRSTPSGPIHLTCNDSRGNGGRFRGTGSVPDGDANIVVKALGLLRSRSGTSHGAEITLHKQIPTAAGLGGGSSDAAAALAVARRAWRLAWSRHQLAALASELGSDVPFFLDGAAAICRGRGEQVQRIACPMRLHLVVAHPPQGLPTQAVFAACRPSERPRSAEPLAEALGHGDLANVGRLLYNRLEEAATKCSHWIYRLRREFQNVDSLGHGMTGSGTSYFGLCRSARHARRIAVQLRSRSVGHVDTVATCHQTLR